jgi:hypothetical protein
MNEWQVATLPEACVNIITRRYLEQDRADYSVSFERSWLRCGLKQSKNCKGKRHSLQLNKKRWLVLTKPAT